MKSVSSTSNQLDNIDEVSWFSMKKISLEQTVQIALEYYQLKQYKQVTQILQPLAQHIVQDDGIYLLMGNAYYCLGQYQQAIEAYLNGIQINADVAESYINLGNAYARLKSYDDAIDAYSKCGYNHEYVEKPRCKE